MIIGLHGNKRAGKDTAYEFIKSAYPDAVRLAFADKIKESLAALFGVSIREINTLKEEKGVFKIQSESFQHSYTWRSFAQRYGTEAHRDIFGENFWVDMILPKESDSIPDDELLIVTDVRFKNEAERIKHLGGYIIYINRLNLLNNDSHISEERLSDEYFSYIINNNASLDQFKERVLEVVSQLVIPHK
jgi:hypothetical protein